MELRMSSVLRDNGLHATTSSKHMPKGAQSKNTTRTKIPTHSKQRAPIKKSRMKKNAAFVYPSKVEETKGGFNE